MASAIRRGLRAEGIVADVATRASDAFWMVRANEFDALVLDVMLPDVDGFEACRLLRAEGVWTPVIMLTAREAVADRVRGLDHGADDYLAKPFGHRELTSRVKALLRRSQMAGPAPKSALRIDDDLTIDFEQREVIARGERIRLRPTEYKLLYHLVSNAGRLLSHEVLLTRVWGREYRDDPQLLRLYITYLRQKIEPDPAHPKYILNERGVGYRFVDFKAATARTT